MAKDPFLIEKKRQLLSKKNDLKNLKLLYKNNLPEIRNINTSTFWNIRQSESMSLCSQDGMTRERIDVAYGFLPKKVFAVLDIGAGYGFIEERLAGKKIDLYGNDISDQAIKILKKRFNGHFKKENILNMKYKNDFFDVIFMLEVLEHIPPSKTFDVLGNINRMLKKDAVFILSVPTNEGLERMEGNPNGHLRMYTEDLIRAELEIAGFKVIRIEKLYAFKNFYVLKRYLPQIFNNIWQPNDLVIKAQKI